jgi:5-methylcytosine-specific restriction endonuclease McrA
MPYKDKADKAAWNKARSVAVRAGNTKPLISIRPRGPRAKKNHCKKGHEFTSENTIIVHRTDRPRPTRRCRICHNTSIRVAGKKWRKFHPEENSAKQKSYRLENKEKIAATALAYRLSNIKKIKAAISKWKKENPEKLTAYVHKCRTAKTKAGGAYTYEQWIALCEKYDNHCLCCGKKKKLTADHIVPVSKGGTSDIRNIQPLCGPCNSSKGNKSTDFTMKKG